MLTWLAQLGLQRTALVLRRNCGRVIKTGLALLIFPAPVVSNVLGTAMLAAGAVQEGIKRQSIYLDDLPKALKSAMKNLKSTKDLV
jgi:hypothetical protein